MISPPWHLLPGLHATTSPCPHSYRVNMSCGQATTSAVVLFQATVSPCVRVRSPSQGQSITRKWQSASSSDFSYPDFPHHDVALISGSPCHPPPGRSALDFTLTYTSPHALLLLQPTLPLCSVLDSLSQGPKKPSRGCWEPGWELRVPRIHVKNSASSKPCPPSLEEQNACHYPSSVSRPLVSMRAISFWGRGRQPVEGRGTD